MPDFPEGVRWADIWADVFNRPDEWVIARTEGLADFLAASAGQAQELLEAARDDLLNAHLEVFLNLPGAIEGIAEDAFEMAGLWTGYIESFVNRATRFDREDWEMDYGIANDDFDWPGWREAMGY